MDSALPLSVAIITLNEEANLPRCLEASRKLASEIVIVDSGSTDRTAEIARSFNARFEVEPWAGHVAQKNKALERCTQPWVLCLDADEVVSPELAAAIHRALDPEQPTHDGWWINRRNFYLGRWIWHAWYPEWRLRLARRDRARWEGRDPHDRLEVSGTTQRLDGDLLHYSYQNLEDHLATTLRYARITARNMENEAQSFHWYHLLLSPWLAFLKRLIVRQGWRDGWRGWLISISAGLSVFAKYAFLLERKLQRESSGEKDNPHH